MSKCPNAPFLSNGAHAFRPRFDTQAPNVAEFRAWGPRTAEIIEAASIKTYTQDVCTRCGAVVLREGGR